MKVFDIFLFFFGVKANKSKCGVIGFDSLQRGKLTLCGMKCIDATSHFVKILGIHCSKNERNEKKIWKIFKAHY